MFLNYVKIASYAVHNEKSMDLRDEMRKVWSQHINWTRMFLVSLTDNLPDLDATQNRLLRNPSDIANVFLPFYGSIAANKIKELFTEHLILAKELVVNLLNGNNAQAQAVNKKWYENADKIADYLASINPNYNRNMLRNMMREHLDILSKQVAMRLEGNHDEEINAFDEGENQALMMADDFSSGIVKQFPDRFN